MKKLLKINKDFLVGKSILLSMLFIVIAMTSIGCPQGASGGQKITINFDESKMDCSYDDKSTGNRITVNTGTQVKETTYLYFKAKDLGDQIVDKWTLNGNATDTYVDGKDYFFYTVNTTDGTSVTIAYTTKTAQKITINFDENKMDCGYEDKSTGNWITVNTGTQVKETTELYFGAKDLGTQLVDKWTVNGNATDTHYDGKNYFFYEVNTTDGTSVTIDYTKK